ncbi:UNVERIFIED_CONTAM: hypothetical protein HDU68_006360 [Siphonaria sp. JEL0065]|nr:hypothetical protein HDU68_006360 [Siphonaria sp. JEL0065]
MRVGIARHLRTSQPLRFTSTTTASNALPTSSTSIQSPPTISITTDPSLPHPQDLQINRLQKSLTDEGFTDHQAKSLFELISSAINERSESYPLFCVQRLTWFEKSSTSSTSTHMVQKEHLEKFTRQSQSELSKLKMDIRNLSVLEYGQLRVELKRIASEVEKLKETVNDNISNTHGGIRLDLNLEKKRIGAEVDALEQLVLNAESKIEKEMGVLLGRIDKMRADMKKGFTNFIATVSVLFVGHVGYTWVFPDPPASVVHIMAPDAFHEIPQPLPSQPTPTPNPPPPPTKEVIDAQTQTIDPISTQAIAHEVAKGRHLISMKYGRIHADHKNNHNHGHHGHPTSRMTSKRRTATKRKLRFSAQLKLPKSKLPL